MLGNAYIVEEGLIEVGVAGDLHQRSQGDARGAHVEKQIAEATVLGGIRVCPGQQNGPVGVVPAAGPDLLPVDHEIIAVLHRPGLHRRHVGAGLRLGVEGTPDILAIQNPGNEMLLVLFGAKGQHRRRDPAHPMDIERARRTVLGQFLVENHLLHDGATLTAVLLGPGNAQKTGGIELAVPPDAEVEVLLRVYFGPGDITIAPPFGQLLHVLRQPVLDFLTKRFFFERILEIHVFAPSFSRAQSMQITEPLLGLGRSNHLPSGRPFGQWLMLPPCGGALSAQ